MPLDATDISTLYRRHARTMLRFFTRRTLDPEAAVDLVAETFAAAFTARAGYRGCTGDEQAGWLYGIARNQLSGWYRRGDVERRALARVGVEPRGLTDPEYERVEELSGLGELRGRVAELVGDLSPADRDALRLRVLEEASYAEVARALGVSEQTARARVSRALRGLAEQLDGATEGVRDHA